MHRAHGLRFVIYVGDHPPAHVHVIGDGTAKVAIDTPIVRLVDSRGLTKADVKRALDIVQTERLPMLDAWERIHG